MNLCYTKSGSVPHGLALRIYKAGFSPAGKRRYLSWNQIFIKTGFDRLHTVFCRSGAG